MRFFQTIIAACLTFSLVGTPAVCSGFLSQPATHVRTITWTHEAMSIRSLWQRNPDNPTTPSYPVKKRAGAQRTLAPQNGFMVTELALIAGTVSSTAAGVLKHPGWLGITLMVFVLGVMQMHARVRKVSDVPAFKKLLRSRLDEMRADDDLWMRPSKLAERLGMDVETLDYYLNIFGWNYPTFQDGDGAYATRQFKDDETPVIPRTLTLLELKEAKHRHTTLYYPKPKDELRRPRSTEPTMKGFWKACKVVDLSDKPIEISGETYLTVTVQPVGALGRLSDSSSRQIFYVRPHALNSNTLVGLRHSESRSTRTPSYLAEQARWLRFWREEIDAMMRGVLPYQTFAEFAAKHHIAIAHLKPIFAQAHLAYPPPPSFTEREDKQATPAERKDAALRILHTLLTEIFKAGYSFEQSFLDGISEDQRPQYMSLNSFLRRRKGLTERNLQILISAYLAFDRPTRFPSRGTTDASAGILEQRARDADSQRALLIEILSRYQSGGRLTTDHLARARLIELDFRKRWLPVLRTELQKTPKRVQDLVQLGYTLQYLSTTYQLPMSTLVSIHRDDDQKNLAGNVYAVAKVCLACEPWAPTAAIRKLARVVMASLASELVRSTYAPIRDWSADRSVQSAISQLMRFAKASDDTFLLIWELYQHLLQHPIFDDQPTAELQRRGAADARRELQEFLRQFFQQAPFFASDVAEIQRAVKRLNASRWLTHHIEIHRHDAVRRRSA